MIFGNEIWQHYKETRPERRKPNKKELNQEMWLCFYIEDRIGVSIIDSIPLCRTEMFSKGALIKKCGFVSI